MIFKVTLTTSTVGYPSDSWASCYITRLIQIHSVR